MYCATKYDYIRTTGLRLITFGLLALGLPSSALALGLSDITVHSSLGERLKANITLLGAQDLTSASCLTLGPDSDIHHVNFTLHSTDSNNTANVSLTSNTILNEPIINLSVIAGCDNAITRHYVLLLDPPLSKPSRDTQSAMAATAPVIDNLTAKPYATKKSAKQSPSTQKRKTKKKTESRKKSAKQNSIKRSKKTKSLSSNNKNANN